MAYYPAARFIAGKLGAVTKAPVAVLLPEKGVSALDAEGMPFHDPEATAALMDGGTSFTHI